MGYSSLVNHVNMTHNMSTGRGGNEVVYIGLHHTAGCISVAQCGQIFKNREASAHYCVDGTDIGCYVDERNTAWALGNFYRNQQSINIEMSNSTGSPNWKVSDTTIQTTIKLVADICYRLGWTYISYTGNMNGDLIIHRWVSSTACPGPYVVNNAIDKYIATEADKLLKAKRNGTATTEQTTVTAKYVTKNSKLVVDGKFGYQSCLKMQKWLGCKYNDGVLSGQSKDMSDYILNMDYCVDYGTGGSYTVKLLQKKIGAKADGYLGPETIKKLQTFLNKNGTKLDVDGYAGTLTCKAFQKYLNNN